MKRAAHDGNVPGAASAARLEKSVRRAVNGVFEICDQLADVVLKDLSGKAHTEAFRLQDISSLYASVREALATSSATIYGLGFAANPQLFAERGLLWWYNAPDSERLPPLNVSVQSGHLTHYDYTLSHWWRGSQGDEKPHLFGPFVDHSGTNAYVVTFSRGVYLRGQQIGLIVGDILVGTLQSLWQSELSALPKPSSLVDEDGIVIATNSARLLGSTLRLAQATVPVTVKGAQWRIVFDDAGSHSRSRKKVA